MKIIIEVNGGVVQEVYCDDPAVAVVLVDWDNKDCPARFPTTPIGQMPDET
jgi:hypothetical protein